MVTSLSVVIPAYNEEANIASCLHKVSAVLKKLKIDSEIIVVDDGSKDKTGAIANSFIGKIHHLKVVTNNPNRGYGGSLRSGYEAATKEFIAYVPSDNQFDFTEITKLLANQAETNSDIVSGIRVGGGVDPFMRKVNRWGWNTLIRALFGYLATDIDCGFKLFRRELLNHIHLTAERGAMIDTQFLASARARGYTVSELPLTHLPRTAGASTGANPRVIVQSFIDLFKFWWQLKQEILVERGLAVFKWEALLIVAVLLLASITRLYHISAYMTFLGDEGRDVRVVRDMLIGKKFTLLGPGTSIGNMYLGPLYYYLMLVPLRLTNFSPVGPAIQIALFGIATVFLLWWTGRQWFGRAAALIVALLYAISPTVIIYSRSSWNPNIMPFFALLAMYGIWKVWRFGYWRWLIVTAASLAITLNSHYLALLLFPVVGLFWFFAPKTPEKSRCTLMSIGLFLLLMSPLFLFDLRHHWTNLDNIAKFFTDRQTTVNLKAYKALPNLWPLWQQIVASLLTAKNLTLATCTSVLLAFSVFHALARRKISPDFWFTLAWLGVALVGLGLYKQHIYDHYFGFIFPVVFLLAGFIIRHLKPFSYFLVVPLILINLSQNPLRYPPNNQLLHTRQIDTFILSQSNNQPFNLALLAKTNYDAGYRYFLEESHAPLYTFHEQITTQLFVICEQDQCDPIGNPLWEIAGFGWAKIDQTWDFPWGVKLFRLVPNPSGKPS